jgi:simple sugar transport system ATP-binding protein
MTTKSSIPQIELRSISKSFGAVQANRSISLAVHPGRIKALLGENGAGKSTLMNIISGHIQPDEGALLLRGSPADLSSPKKAIEAGIGMVHQHFMLAEALTVAENVALGHKKGILHRQSRLEAEIKQVADGYGLDIDPGARVCNLSMGEKQRVEILRLLYRQCSVLILDEPTTVLTPKEIEQLFASLRRMAEQGKAVLFISHKLSEVMDIAEEIAILRRGEIVEEKRKEDVASTRELALRMVGREVFLKPERPAVAHGETVLRVQSLYGDCLEDISLEVKKGEILAVVGVAGNGQKSLVQLICGLCRPARGRIEILGRPWESFHASAGWQAGLSYIPEDRLGLATCPNLDLGENFLLTTRQGFSKGGLLSLKALGREADRQLAAFNVAPRELRLKARQLSGGNLQKLVLARELYRRPQLIVAEQPSQGLDVAATEEVWSHLLRARERAGILLVSGDLNEALSLADRIAVIFRGRFMDLFAADDKDKVSHIGPLMAGIPHAS